MITQTSSNKEQKILNYFPLDTLCVCPPKVAVSEWFWHTWKHKAHRKENWGKGIQLLLTPQIKKSMNSLLQMTLIWEAFAFCVLSFCNVRPTRNFTDLVAVPWRTLPIKPNWKTNSNWDLICHKLSPQNFLKEHPYRIPTMYPHLKTLDTFSGVYGKHLKTPLLPHKCYQHLKTPLCSHVNSTILENERNHVGMVFLLDLLLRAKHQKYITITWYRFA